jgi:tetratricopeptide (TPR) repeat protein
LTLALVLFMMGAGVLLPFLVPSDYIQGWVFFVGSALLAAATLADVLLTHLRRQEPGSSGGVATHIPVERPRKTEHFTGREKELEELVKVLQPGALVTLCGPGGIGKSALAAEAVWRLGPDDASHPPERFPDGILYHDFYLSPQAAGALEAIARAYGEEPKPSPAAAARRALAGRKALLLLDGAENADDLAAVLGVAASCGVLVTSRRREDAAGGCRIEVDPLPDPQALTLLRAWAGMRAGDEAAGKRICTLLGGLPLALRLAGAYLATHEEEAADYLAWMEQSPLAALDHGQRQHESVPLLLARSLEQVSEGARAALAVAGVLALAPFSREVMAAALDVPADEAGRRLGELVNYGLLARPEERYVVSHALVHTYARERLEVDLQAMDRLARYYTGHTYQLVLQGPAGYVMLNQELQHLVAVVEASARQGLWERVKYLGIVLDKYLDLQGHSNERARILEMGVTAARALGERRDEGACLGHLGMTYLASGQNESAIHCLGQALAIAQEIGEDRDVGSSLNALGTAYLHMGQHERAIGFYWQALANARKMKDRQRQAHNLGGLANSYLELKDARRAAGSYKRALAISRQLGDRRGEGESLGGLGNVRLLLGDVQGSIGFYEQALAIFQEIGDRSGEAHCLGNLGSAYRALGQMTRAVEYCERALVMFEEIHSRYTEQAGNLLEVVKIEASLRIALQGLVEDITTETIRAMTSGDSAQTGRLWDRLGELRTRLRGQEDPYRVIDFLEAVQRWLEGSREEPPLGERYAEAWRRIVQATAGATTEFEETESEQDS